MFDLRQIVANNNSTFYDYASGARKSVWPRIVALGAIALSVGLLLPSQSDDFLNAVLTVQSILVGFSFSVLFFLLENSEVAAPDDDSIERQLKRERLSKLGKELFYNVSYYNTSAISSVILALFLMTAGPDQTTWKLVAEFIGRDLSVDGPVAEVATAVSKTAVLVATIGLYFFLIESLYTFYRTVLRVSFYFERKLELNQVEE